MSQVATTFHQKLETGVTVRQRVIGVLFLVLAVITGLYFAGAVQPDQTATFGMVAGGSKQSIDPLVVPAQNSLYFLAVIMAVVGGVQIARGFRSRTNLMLGVVVLLFVFGFLIWAAAGKFLNLAGLLNTTLIKSVPLTLGAMAGILCERSGIVNIAIEGMMLSSAMTSTLIASVTGSLWLGLIAGMLTGGLMALLLAVLSIRYKTNQVVAGTVINILATGLTSYVSAKFLQVYQGLNNPGTFKAWPIPLLSDIPLIGPILFNNNIFVYGMFIMLVVLHVALFYTKWGLRMRSVGEHPKAADTLGINVFRIRYYCTFLGGLVAGFAGAYFTLGSVGRFDGVMTARRGFISLAAMLFGHWMPFGSFGAGLLFGFADSLASRLAILQVAIPSQVLLMAPYIATMIVLAGVIGRSRPPAAEGVPYEKE